MCVEFGCARVYICVQTCVPNLKIWKYSDWAAEVAGDVLHIEALLIPMKDEAFVLGGRHHNAGISTLEPKLLRARPV